MWRQFLNVGKQLQNGSEGIISSYYQNSKKPEACKFIKKETLAQVFSCEFREISKNTFSYRTPLLAASEQASL